MIRIRTKRSDWVDAIVFLQQEFEGLPAGTPLIRTKMSSAHAQGVTVR